MPNKSGHEYEQEAVRLIKRLDDTNVPLWVLLGLIACNILLAFLWVVRHSELFKEMR